MLSEKYGRTYHYPFSPGTTSDDRINHTYWEDIRQISTLVHTEKLDGENNCLSRYGVFARSHVAPTTSPWTSQLRQRWELLKNDLGDIELFGENLYAVHSIEYKRLETHFYVFAVRCLDKWLSWDEVKFYAALFDLPTVPELYTECVDGLTVASLNSMLSVWRRSRVSSAPVMHRPVWIVPGKEWLPGISVNMLLPILLTMCLSMSVKVMYKQGSIGHVIGNVPVWYGS